MVCSWIRKCNIIKAAILPKAIQAFNAIAVEVAIVLFEKQQATTTKPPEIFAKFTENLKGLHITQSLGSFRPQIPWIQNTWQSYSNQNNVITGIKTDMQIKSTEEGSEIDPHVYVKWSSAKKLASCVEKGSTRHKTVGKLYIHMLKNEDGPLSIYIKINPKWIKKAWPCDTDLQLQLLRRHRQEDDMFKASLDHTEHSGAAGKTLFQNEK